MNRDRVLAEAIDKVHALSPGYAPPEPPVFNLPGPSGKAALALAVGEFARTARRPRTTWWSPMPSRGC